MTDGEKLVWAAVFTQEYMKVIYPNPNLYFADKNHKKKEQEKALEDAILQAAEAIRKLRNKRGDFEKENIKTYDSDMLEEMLK